MLDDEKIIELVRQYPVLYDINHSKYLDYALKLKIWKLIGKQIKTDAPTVKNRWNNMRDTYRKSLRKLSNNNTSIKKVKQYKYSDQLCFMKDYFDDKKPWSNTEQLDEVDYTLDELPEITDDVQEDEFELNLVDYQVNEDSESQKSEKSATKRKRDDSTTELVMKYILNKETNQNTNSVDPIDAFLSGIAPTLKSLHPYLLNLAKSEIFATVQKYELKMLQNVSGPISLDGTNLESVTQLEETEEHFMKIEK